MKKNTIVLISAIILVFVIVFLVVSNKNKSNNDEQTINVNTTSSIGGSNIEQNNIADVDDSVSSYDLFVKRVLALQEKLSCSCIDGGVCYICKIGDPRAATPASYYMIYGLDDRFIAFKVYTDTYKLEAYKYSLDGESLGNECESTTTELVQETCPIYATENRNRVDLKANRLNQ